MDTHELRLFNWVLFVDKPYKIASLDRLSVTIYNRWVKPLATPVTSCFIPAVNIEPIPLTEEWLLRFGCTKCGSVFSLPKSIEDKCVGDNGLHYVSMFFNNRLNRWMDCQTRVCVDFVHQFQNLVFINTGEELEIKL